MVPIYNKTSKVTKKWRIIAVETKQDIYQVYQTEGGQFFKVILAPFPLQGESPFILWTAPILTN